MDADVSRCIRVPHGADCHPSHLRIGIVRGHAGQCANSLRPFEIAKHTDGFASHLGVRVGKGFKRRLECFLDAQRPNCVQGCSSHGWLRVDQVRKDRRSGRGFLEFCECVSHGVAHRRIGIL